MLLCALLAPLLVQKPLRKGDTSFCLLNVSALLGLETFFPLHSTQWLPFSVNLKVAAKQVLSCSRCQHLQNSLLSSQVGEVTTLFKLLKQNLGSVRWTDQGLCRPPDRCSTCRRSACTRHCCRSTSLLPCMKGRRC